MEYIMITIYTCIELLISIIMAGFMAQDVCIISWNVRGVMSSTLSLSNTLDLCKPDVAIICEHKLSTYNFSFLDTIHSEYTAFPKDTGHDGCNYVSFLVKKSLLFSVSFVNQYSKDRIIVLEINTSNK